ncbi:MAG: stalk domain-containing protein [Caldisericia bacterium]
MFRLHCSSLNPFVIRAIDDKGNEIDSKSLVIKNVGTFEILYWVSDVNCTVDRKSEILDIPPRIVDNRTFLPADTLSEHFRLNVNVSDDSITLKRDNMTNIMTIGKPEFELSGKKRFMDTKPFIEDGRIWLPVRFVSEEFGGAVNWDSLEKSVEITFYLHPEM